MSKWYNEYDKLIKLSDSNLNINIFADNFDQFEQFWNLLVAIERGSIILFDYYINIKMYAISYNKIDNYKENNIL